MLAVPNELTLWCSYHCLGRLLYKILYSDLVRRSMVKRVDGETHFKMKQMQSTKIRACIRGCIFRSWHVFWLLKFRMKLLIITFKFYLYELEHLEKLLMSFDTLQVRISSELTKLTAFNFETETRNQPESSFSKSHDLNRWRSLPYNCNANNRQRLRSWLWENEPWGRS